jgi:uncharacterized protein (TIGR04222 family)
MADPAPGDTWGISGPTFLAGYALLAALVGVWWLWTRGQARTARPVKHPPGDLTRYPQDVAYLNGGASLAIFSALSGMRMHGWVTLSGGAVRAAGQVGSGASELERAIHRASTKPVRRVALPAQAPVATALRAVVERLTRAGLLVPDAARTRLRWIAGWMAAVAALGLYRMLAGLGNQRPIGYLVLLFLLVLVAATVMFLALPRRTRLGDEMLTELRSRQHDLNPASKPDWTVYGPVAAAMGVGLFGVDALWASDPAMAAELAAHRASAASGSTVGGVDGGSSGGGSSCGGGGCGGGGCGG